MTQYNNNTIMRPKAEWAIELKNKLENRVKTSSKREAAAIVFVYKAGDFANCSYDLLAWKPDSLTAQRVWSRSVGKRLFPGWWTLV